MSRNHGHRYYAWTLAEGQFQFEEHPVNLPREKKYEGKYLIQTDQTELTPLDGVAHYKELNEVERGFRSLKNPLGMPPSGITTHGACGRTFSSRPWRS